MTDQRRLHPQLADLGGIRRLVDRVLRRGVAPQVESWGDDRRPVLGRHWPLADTEWHREREWTAAGRTHHQRDDQLTRFALLPDGRLVRADRMRSEIRTAGPDGERTDADPWVETVRTMSAQDIALLDRRIGPTSTTHGSTRTWGSQPVGDPVLPWLGAGLENLLASLLRQGDAPAASTPGS